MKQPGKTRDLYLDRKQITKIAPSFDLVYKFIKNKKTVDLGCGDGAYLEKLSKDSIGIDVSDENIRLLKSKGLSCLKADLNAELPIKDDVFSVVLCSHLLEHIDSPIHLLKEINRILVPGGKIILFQPTEISIVRLFSDKYFGGHSTHLYGFSLGSIQRILKLSGFKIETIIVIFPILSKLRLLGIIRLLNKFYKSLLMPFSTSYWVVAKNE